VPRKGKKLSQSLTRKQLSQRVSKLSKQLKQFDKLQREIAKSKKAIAKADAPRVKALQAKALEATQVQRSQEKQKRAFQNAKKTLAAFKPSKKDFGKVVFIGTKGSKDAAGKGRKGYAVYVDKKGKKQIIPDYKDGLKPKKISEYEFPVSKRTRKKYTEFKQLRREVLHREISTAETFSVKSKSLWDFSEGVIEKITSTLAKRFKSQKAQRSFTLKANITCKGVNAVYRVEVLIKKPDYLSIEAGGLKNFVRQKFYADFAKQLSFDGYVTSGSANHIRKALNLKRNPSLKSWKKYHKQAGHKAEWLGDSFSIVQIETIEWQLEQNVRD
jgi:hypothetical protein